jgi:hypothetical protein
MQVAPPCPTCKLQNTSAHPNKNMSKTSYLHGKVQKQSLPLFEKPPQGMAEGPKRLLLPQGELANFYDADEGIRYAAFIELRVGGIRGNHIHQVKEEQVYLISGELLLVAQEGLDGQRVSLDIKEGDLVKIATGVAHAFNPIKAGFAIEFSKTRFDPLDVQRVVLI